MQHAERLKVREERGKLHTVPAARMVADLVSRWNCRARKRYEKVLDGVGVSVPTSSCKMQRNCSATTTCGVVGSEKL